MSQVIDDTIFDKIEKLLSGQVATVLARQAVIALGVYLPFLLLPVVRQMATVAMAWLLRFIIRNTTTGLELIYIDVKVGTEIRRLQKAHRTYVLLKQQNRIEELEGAKDELAKAYRRAIRFNS